MWIYNSRELTEEDLENYAGFVYLIENLKTGKKYIGKKIAKFSKTKQVKGKKKKIKVKSDWQTYYGSNKELLEDIKKQGEKDFKRTVLYLCKTKGIMSYYEAYEQFWRGALLNPNEFYNEWIMCKIHRSHVKSIYA